MATIMIGSIKISLASANAEDKQLYREVVRRHDKTVSDCFAKLQYECEARAQHYKYGNIVKVPGTRFFTVTAATELQKVTRRVQYERYQSLSEEVAQFEKEDAIIDCIQVEEVQSCPATIIERGVVHSLGRRRVRKQVAKTVRCSLDNLTRALCNIVKKRGMEVDIVGERRKTKAKYIRYNERSYLKVSTLHELGLRRKRDIHMDKWTRKLLQVMLLKSSGAQKNHAGAFAKGSSGIVLDASKLTGKFGTSRNGLFVIRGRVKDVLMDSQSILTTNTTLQIDHYSVEHKFWRGYDRGFLLNRPTTTHTCTSDLDVEECGYVASLATLALFPCGKITCESCIAGYCNEGKRELRDRHLSRLDELIEQISTKHAKFKHVVMFLAMFRDFLAFENDNVSDFGEVERLIGARKETPFKQLKTLNEILIKVGNCTKEEVSQGTKTVLELTRFQRNRTDNIAKGSLDHFRNKLSAKSHINLNLMCDNQLDENANFQWRQRAYHAKRLLSNYFEVVNPERGYEQHVKRPHPNGFRKTAIGKFIISTNFEAFHNQLKGEPICKMELSKECTSRLPGGFVYPCCCVTTDEGKPIETRLIMPTKNHIVIGNTGDSKMVLMPQVTEEQMYIARDGYCHVNIFLAMLINISEVQAKDFTKAVRDVVMHNLKEWPSMLDVALACRWLATSFPDVLSAELPKILVDHNTKTMHVLDSYGSLSTGYHILKANTVGHLLLFVDHDLESEMMFYKVGGLGDHQQQRIKPETHIIKSLIKGIFRPKIMASLLNEEPLLILYGLLSPRVLCAMSEQRCFETALNQWLTQDVSVAVLCEMMEKLARKVSAATLLAEQHIIIQQHATYFIDQLQRVTHISPARTHVIRMLEKMAEQSLADKELVAAGFANLGELNQGLEEKKSQLELDQAWSDLSWLEKLRALLRSCGSSRKEKIAGNQENVGSGGTYREQIHSSLGSLRHKVLKRTTAVKEKCVRSAYELFGKCFCRLLMSAKYVVPDIGKYFNVLMVFFVLVRALSAIRASVQTSKRIAHENAMMKDESHFRQLVEIYELFALGRTEPPTEDEFKAHLLKVNPEIHGYFLSLYQEEVSEQSKGKGQVELERVIAFMALIMMFFDAERSDCVYKVLCKLKGLMSPITAEPVAFQSYDDIPDLLGEKKMSIDLELDTENHQLDRLGGATFEHWWQNQLTNGRTIPHYRTEGRFMEFTRATAPSVAAEIAHSSYTDFLVMGAVGSGKSTGLPYYLSKKGKVLVIEPTKPLAENVHKQLAGEPFMSSATLKMRGHCVFGSAPIVVMTSGYALHYYANDVRQLSDLQFVIIDECHVHDANAMAFRSLLEEHEFGGKVLKVSATPPGRDVTFTTQHPVKIKVEESLSFQQFVQAQGTGSNADVIACGDNILVYVASYNEVDALSKLLQERRFKVTKVDGRTMKLGNVEIPTTGTPDSKHFVVATNIIENGVTLDIDVVVDFGQKVIPELDMDSRMIRYNKVQVSYGERIQRLGRVGRHKEGTALRIGFTEKGLSAIPGTIATEAAFYCFAYGLPVMTSGVALGVIAKCTVQQARTMMHFELPIFYTVNLVRFDGSMHPAIHQCLKGFKLRDSEIILNKMAVPNSGVKFWLTGSEYNKLGARVSVEESTKIPFYTKEIPDRTHEQVWNAVLTHRKEAGYGKLSSASACKVAYTLQTDVHSLQRTICIIDELIKSEIRKQEHFKSVTSIDCGSTFSLVSLANAFRARHLSNHTAENISVLQAAKGQLEEFRGSGLEVSEQTVREFGILECTQYQSSEEVSKFLNLQAHWNHSLIVNDVLIAGATLLGGAWMIFNYFRSSSECVQYQAKGKRQNQKLRFQRARDHKHAHEINNDDGAAEYYFGEAYAKKAPKKGKTRGMGTKSRRFYNMYGFDPSDYTFARYVDPLTGHTKDESPLTDVQLVQEHFGTIRKDLILEDEIDAQSVMAHPNLEVYFVKDLAKQVLKIDLTPHNPLLVCANIETIAGHPERAGELRQTGNFKMVDRSLLPERKELEMTNFESKSTYQGLRDYNSISTVICHLENDSEGHTTSIFGLGYGSMIITNQHLFRRNNGTLRVNTHRGSFFVPNTTQLKMHPFPDRDLLLIQMPKDFPPFPQKLKMRNPVAGDKVCLVGSNFQTKYISSTVSETSAIAIKDGSHFVRHWISTKDGQCGLPLVSVKDGYILGIHSLTSLADSSGFFITFPHAIIDQYLEQPSVIEWQKQWRLNPELSSWGDLKVKEDKPDNLFRLSKDIGLLSTELCGFQGCESRWLYNKLEGNLKAVAQTQNQLVTKHVVKGKCHLFSTYLDLHNEAKDFFTPLMGAYQKSRLNKEAYIKDLFKYNSDVTVGALNSEAFEIACVQVVQMMTKAGFSVCDYITDTETIFSALNMKAAVGALYTGKKKEYFEHFTDADKAEIIKDSCKRLYLGKMGVWNGSLKAELRPSEKVEANKTRTFTAAPIDTLLGGKVCVDDFNNQFYSLNLEAPWSVGMTKFYGGWDKLMAKLPEGWVYCDADGSQFDSSLTPYLINAVLNIRLQFMEEWDIGAEMLRNLYTEIVYTPIATPDGTIIKKFKGNNSGQPSTVVDNTLMVILAMYYAGNLYDAETDLDTYCKFFVNGDDLLIAVEPTKETFLDGLQCLFGHLGLKYDFTSRHTNKRSLWFMSHKAIDCGNMLIPKLEEERIVSILEWDRANLPEHRLEAICASMIEAWGYPHLLKEIRKFYYWVLEQAPYNLLSAEGKAPYISEVALEHLYTGSSGVQGHQRYLQEIVCCQEFGDEFVQYQASEVIDAGQGGNREKGKDKSMNPKESEDKQVAAKAKDKDVDVGTSGTFQVPRLKTMGSKMTLPKIKGRVVVNLEHLLTYEPDQSDISNARATHSQYATWYDGVKAAYEVTDEEMGILLNGFMVWCIENGTSPNINGNWTMMDGDEQVEYPVRPMIENAQPSLRQIMAHFSPLAEAYIEKRNATKPYMPRYGAQRNLRDMSLARFAFDFFEITSRTPIRAREAHMQMKAAALRNSTSHMFGLDGNAGDKEENTERHTVNDVNRDMHHMMGVRL